MSGCEKTSAIGGTIVIGRKPENAARTFRFDLSEYFKQWPKSTPKLMVQRPSDSETYIAITNRDRDSMLWTVSRYDTEKVGFGSAWIVFFGDDQEQLGISEPITIRVMDGPVNIDGSEPPETSIPWVQAVIEAADRAEAAADRAENAGGGGTGGEGTPGKDGEDGGYYMPSVDDDGNLSWQASKEDMPDVQTVNIKGEKGDTGAAGKDGQDGKDGTPGENGADGYTPQRGTDYWTEADKQEIVDEVLEAMPEGGTGGGIAEYRLLREIELTEDAARVEITSDAEGEEINLMSVITILDILAASASGRIRVRCGTLDNTTLKGILTYVGMQNAIHTAARKTICMTDIVADRFSRFEYSVGGTAGGFTLASQDDPYKVDCIWIESIDAQAIPAGSKISVYGRDRA